MNRPPLSVFRLRPLLSTVCAAVAFCSPVRAEENRWTVENGAWAEGGNWSASRKPGKEDKAIINNNGTAILSGNGGDVAILQIGGRGVEGNLVLEPSSRLNFLQTSSLGGGSLTVRGRFGSLDSALMIGSAQLRIEKGGTVHVGVAVKEVSGFRIGIGDSNPTVIIDGGTLRTNGEVRVGGGNRVEALFVLKNDGIVQSKGENVYGLGGGANYSFQNVTTRFVIGGEEQPEGPGKFENIAKLSGYQPSDYSNSNTIIFNHTNPRYELRQITTDEPLLLHGSLAVELKSGVTVLSGANDYTGQTSVGDGAVLLANFEDANNPAVSATGATDGDLQVASGGVVGGAGSLNGNVVISGTLKPGDYDYGNAEPDYGTLKIRGDLALQPTGAFVIGINGRNAAASVDVTGKMALAGTLAVNLRDGFALNPGETLRFQIFRSEKTSGAFASHDLPATWKGRTLTWDFTNTRNGQLSVTAGN